MQPPHVQPLFIGIAGGSGSGKSTIARKVAAGLPPKSVVVIDHDAYYYDRPELSLDARFAQNYDHPDALESNLLAKQLDALRQGQAIDAPQYDFLTHRRCAATRRILPTPVIIVEGILVFADEGLRTRLDVKIFVDTDADIRLFRRIRRDMQDRGRTFDCIRDQYYRHVRPMHQAFVEPSKRWADLIIPEGGNNHVALDLVISKLSNVAHQARVAQAALPSAPMRATSRPSAPCRGQTDTAAQIPPQPQG